MQYSISCSHHLYLTSPWLSCFIPGFSPVQSLSCVQLFVTPWTAACPGFPVHHQLPELAQTHVHRVGDSIQWSHPLSSSSPSAFNLSSIRILSSESVFGIRWQSIGASASVFPVNIQGWFPLGCIGWISLQAKGLSRVFSNNIVENHQFFYTQFSPVQFSRSVVSDSLWPHELQHARPPCPSPTPRVHSDSRPSSQWCHPAISSSVVPFSSCPQSLPASEFLPMSQLFTWGG